VHNIFNRQIHIHNICKVVVLFKFNLHIHSTSRLCIETILDRKHQSTTTTNSDQSQDIRVDIFGCIDWSQIDRFCSNNITAESSVVLEDIAWSVLCNTNPNTLHINSCWIRKLLNKVTMHYVQSF